MISGDLEITEYFLNRRVGFGYAWAGSNLDYLYGSNESKADLAH
jgi:hypothetical protein